MKRTLTAAVLLLAATAGFAGDSGASAALDAALANPPATGLLVVRVVPGTQAEKLGIREGDVIVAYGDAETPDLAAMNYAKRLAGEAKNVPVRIVRADGEVTVSLAPGRMGVQLLSVEAGNAVEPLPASTDVVLDLSGIPETPREDWYALYRDGKKNGVGRIEVSRVGRVVYIATDEIYHGGGEEPELCDHEVAVAMTATKEPRPVLTVFHDHLNDLTRIGAVDEIDGGTTTLAVMTTGAGSDGRRDTVPLPHRPIPSYAIETVTTLMPREKSACLRFQPLIEGRGETGLPSAIRCAGFSKPGAEGGEGAWIYEWHELGAGVVARYWVNDEGRMIRANYGIIEARRTTEEDAHADQPKDISDRVRR